MNKQKGGASVFILSIYIIFLLLVVCFFSFQTRLLNHLRDDFDTGLLFSLLGTATINTDEYGLSGCRVLHETYTGDGSLLTAPDNASCSDYYLEKAISTFRSLLKGNLGLDDNMNSRNSLIRSQVLIEEFKIYNVYEVGSNKRIYEFSWNNGSWSCITHAINEVVLMPDGTGQEITDSILYAKIGFDIAIFPYFSAYQDNIPDDSKIVRVYLNRTVSIYEKQ